MQSTTFAYDVTSMIRLAPWPDLEGADGALELRVAPQRRRLRVLGTDG